MRSLIYISILLMLGFSPSALSQIALDRVLIGSGYSEFGQDGVYISGSIGEPVVTTEENSGFIMTQGFQQSNYVMNSPFILELSATKAACLGANDGTVSISFISENIAPPLTYQWSNGETTPQLLQAEVGVYDITVSGSDGNSVTSSVTVGAIDSVDCTPGFYTGITPNGDNFNDYWHIDNAEFFTGKSVEIFNRYGTRVWNTEAYDNETSAFTGNHNNGNNLPDGTYFYIAKFDGSTFKGWIEISR